jgi:GNAT superfamily N-acetyltransferase
MSAMPVERPADGPRKPGDGVEIRLAHADEVEDVLPLLRAYCDFYGTDPSDDGLRDLAQSLIANPDQGALFIARDTEGAAIGVAALGWKWSSTRGARVGYLEDLFVAADRRGAGVADGLIDACAALCRERGAPVLLWQTAPDNKRAQSVYERVGAAGSEWIEYELEL